MYRIEQAEEEDLLLNYKEIKSQLEKALEYSDGERTAKQIILNSISQPQIYQIWRVFKDGLPVALGSLRYIKYEQFTAIHLTTLSGTTGKNLFDADVYNEWADIFEKEIKKNTEIDMLEITGRRGFVRQLKKAGWTERYTTMRKSLKETLDGY
jgi:hypothetical protein